MFTGKPARAGSEGATSLSELRNLLKELQKQNAGRRGPWQPVSLEKFPLPSQPRIVGHFSPRVDWDEPSSMPRLPAGTRVALPRIEQNELHFCEAQPEDLILNSFGILEPRAEAPHVKPDFLFVPALTVDRDGNRVGRGRGFYDRYLSRHPDCISVAVIHSDYVPDHLAAQWIQPHDQKVSALVTDSYFHLCGGNNP